ncbi:Hsp33 family molecular chaperone HslO [Spongiibacter sp. KMU-158]|uniref:33 kDa chaperonin n=1 Tax=Spongiibacter pelagi TaxID=2760804 RepID=A0A927C026_9GAMM|nr:Hsp33 family molecular chaperone HslO [Spongiibacter pelagi]MBD2857693.1 Hsp33 family molecular chaperone HslO [Spongiibacter pelagi]
MSDTLHRFIFDHCEIRGEHLQLEQSYQQILANHHYPPGVAKLLGEFLVAAGLLSATLKFEGSLILQVRGDGEIPLIMAEANSKREIRAIARDANQAMSEDFHQLLGNAQLAITIDPVKGVRYQGIVSLEGNSLAACLEKYFEQSEQLATRIWLHADNGKAAGLFLQQLPGAQQQADDWEHLVTLANTASPQEMLELDAGDMLYRLYHEEPLRLFPGESVRFQCSCSQERIEKALVSLGKAELASILEEQGEIESHCEICHRRYYFSGIDVQALIAGCGPENHTRH